MWKGCERDVTFLVPISQNGQTHCLSVFDHFVGLAFKGLSLKTSFCVGSAMSAIMPSSKLSTISILLT